MMTMVGSADRSGEIMFKELAEGGGLIAVTVKSYGSDDVQATQATHIVALEDLKRLVNVLEISADD